MRRLFRRAATNLWMSGTLTATAALAFGLAACGNETEGGIEGSTCVSTQELFAVDYFKLINNKCGACHQYGSIGAEGSDFKLRPNSEAGFLDANMEIVKKVAGFESNGRSVFLDKPLGNLQHGGGKIFESEEDPEYKQLAELVTRLQEPDSCPNTEARFLAGVQLMGPGDTLRKAALVLAARLPTDEEIAAVEAGGWPAVDKALDTFLQEKAFYDRLMEKYNDIMLTDFYLNGDDFDFIQDNGMEDEAQQYDPRWFENITYDSDTIKKYGAQNSEDAMNRLRVYTRYGVARASLELISYVVKNDRPFHEIASANYMVVNPFSARAYKIPDAEFVNDSDPNEFVPAKFGGYESDFPHTGILTDPVWLQRHPTTPTNRNRHRAKEVLFMLLGNDILKAAERPIAIDANTIADNPTVNNPACSVCHSFVDPIAGTFRNFQYTENEDDNNIAYRPDFEWYAEMQQTGFKGVTMPPTEKQRALPWLGKQIAIDDGFNFGAVFMAYRTLTGNEPLIPPAEGSQTFDEELTAYLGQYYTFSVAAKNFKENGQNFKSLVKELVMSPYFRAMNTAPDIDSIQLSHLTAVGTAHLLTPEQLNRKVANVTGIYWTPDNQGHDDPELLDRYRILFGGIDSMNTTVRIKEPSGIMANVIERMGLEVGCKMAHAEFLLLPEDRKWLKNVDLTVEPRDANGYDVPDAVSSIKADIKHLHLKLLGERLEDGDPELERTYQLFVDVWAAGKAGIAGGTVGTEFPGECRNDINYVTGQSIPEEQVWSEDGLYTARAWGAVFAYLLSDYAFVYE